MFLLLLLIALVGFSFGSSSSESATVRAAPAARVPSVTGLYTQHAVRRIARAGVVPILRWCTVPSSQYAVVRQRPRAGVIVPRGARVQLFLVPALGQGVRHPACRTFVTSRP